MEDLSGLPKDESKIENLQIYIKIRNNSLKKSVMLLEKIRSRMGGIEFQKNKSNNENIINHGQGPHVL